MSIPPILSCERFDGVADNSGGKQRGKMVPVNMRDFRCELCFPKTSAHFPTAYPEICSGCGSTDKQDLNQRHRRVNLFLRALMLFKVPPEEFWILEEKYFSFSTSNAILFVAQDACMCLASCGNCIIPYIEYALFFGIFDKKV